MCTESICDDGIDNDGDNQVDCDDNDCDSFEACFETLCNDEIDNDGDGQIDCGDSDCDQAEVCHEYVCDDGIDSDSDLLTDCEDNDCFNQPPCIPQAEISLVGLGTVAEGQVFDLGEVVGNAVQIDGQISAVNPVSVDMYDFTATGTGSAPVVLDLPSVLMDVTPTAPVDFAIDVFPQGGPFVVTVVLDSEDPDHPFTFVVQGNANDLDGDAFTFDVDCNDDDPAVNPGAPEVCGDGIDNDCSEIHDDADFDADGYVGSGCGGSDCDDNDPAVNPSANEGCDGNDSNCNGLGDDVDPVVGAAHFITSAPLPVGIVVAPSATTTSTLTVAETGTITDLSVTLNLAHAALADVTVSLTSPTGTAATLLSGQATGDGLAGTTFDDEAPGPLDNVAAPYPAIYVPDEALSAFDGESAAGVWTLTIVDSGSTGGSLNAWSLFGILGPLDDSDGDGVNGSCGDCDDANPTVFPGAEELCDNIDNDCDGALGAIEADGDADGITGCAGDCDNADPNTFPGAQEMCDGADNDCNGAINDRDEDLDGFAPGACGGTDCNDNDPTAFPGAVEVCDNADTNCDGNEDVNDLTVGASTFLGEVAPGTSLTFVGPHTSTLEVTESGAVQDANVAVTITGVPLESLTVTVTNPAGTAVPLFDFSATGGNLIGTVFDDEAPTAVAAGTGAFLGSYVPESPLSAVDGAESLGTWTLTVESAVNVTTPGQLVSWQVYGTNGPADDSDNDGAVDSCGDCDPNDPTTFPGAPELCNGGDNDCDGAVPVDESDGDGDAVPPCGGDCDDADPGIFPGAVEICDGINNDCAGGPDDIDNDLDGFIDVDCGGSDCDDADPATNPAAVEACDTADSNCDGNLDLLDLTVNAPSFDGADSAGGLLNSPGDNTFTLEVSEAGTIEDANAAISLESVPLEFLSVTLTSPAGATVVLVEPGTAGSALSGAVFDDFGTAPLSAASPPFSGFYAPVETLSALNGGASAGTWTLTISSLVNVTDGGTLTSWRVFGLNGPADDADNDGNVDSCGDCDANDPATFPGANEICDGGDNDCDGVIPAVEIDADTDTFSECEGDCDDGDPATNPVAVEICDGLNNDCTGGPDDIDIDLDGFIDGACGGTDCNDADPTTHPAAVELCDTGDSNCDGNPDLLDLTVSAPSFDSTDAPAGFLMFPGDYTFTMQVAESGTIEDANASITLDSVPLDFLSVSLTSPAGTTVLLVEPGTPGSALSGAVFDDFGTAPLSAASPPFSGFYAPVQPLSALNGGPSAGTWTLTVSSLVNATVAGTLTSWRVFGLNGPPDDADNDGNVDSCGDCDGGDPATFPGANEICDGADNNCDGVIPAVEIDADTDAFSECEGDCDAADPLTFPGANEVCDGNDNNCDGVIPAVEIDADTDTFSECEGDCAPTEPLTFPGANEICDGGDNNCDGIIPTDELNIDGDPASGCEGDCDDNNPAVFPGAPEVCNDSIDNDCDPATADLFDEDGDGDTCDVDCNDDLNTVGPSVAEVGCNSIDDDCNPATPDVFDGDFDAFDCNEDCNDDDAAINPDAPEVNGDGIDNDCDGNIDDAVEVLCDDGLDDDFDGLIDCLDPDCTADPACATCEDVALGDQIGSGLATANASGGPFTWSVTPSAVDGCFETNIFGAAGDVPGLIEVREDCGGPVISSGTDFYLPGPLVGTQFPFSTGEDFFVTFTPDPAAVGDFDVDAGPVFGLSPPFATVTSAGPGVATIPAFDNVSGVISPSNPAGISDAQLLLDPGPGRWRVTANPIAPNCSIAITIADDSVCLFNVDIADSGPGALGAPVSIDQTFGPGEVLRASFFDFDSQNCDGSTVDLERVEDDCTDLVDNDLDSLVDCNDPDCDDDPTCTEQTCDDVVDNDSDTLTDCDDPDCLGDPACAEADCADGLDNDGDGDIDCADFDCWGGPACPYDFDLFSTLGTPVLSEDNTLFGDDFQPVCGPNPGPDISATWTAPADGDYEFTTHNSAITRTVLSIFDSSGNLLDCDRDGGIGWWSFISLSLLAGDELVIQIDGDSVFQAGVVDLNITEVVPPESDCADSIDNDGDGDTDCADSDCDSSADCVTCDVDLGSAVGAPVASGDTTGAGHDHSPTCNFLTGNDVSYCWTVPDAGCYTFDTALGGTLADTVLNVRDATGASLVCDDDGGPGFLSSAQLCGRTPSETLVIWVDAYDSSSNGTFQLSIAP